jgi:hypothetical protein
VQTRIVLTRGQAGGGVQGARMTSLVVDLPRARRQRLETELDRRGWAWSCSASYRLDALILSEENSVVA